MDNQISEVIEIDESKIIQQTPQQKEEPQQAKKVFYFELFEAEINLILKACGELPTKETFHFVTKIFNTVEIHQNQKFQEEYLKAIIGRCQVFLETSVQGNEP